MLLLLVQNPDIKNVLAQRINKTQMEQVALLCFCPDGIGRFTSLITTYFTIHYASTIYNHYRRSELLQSQLTCKDFRVKKLSGAFLTHIWPVLHTYRNRPIHLLYKSIDWFL